jgi:hypothetical protein
LTQAPEVASLYQSDDGAVDGLNHLSNRELDIWEPIFILANLIDKKAGNRNLTSAMEQLSRESTAEKQADSVDQNETYKVLNILKQMFEEIGCLEVSGDVKTYDANIVFEYFKNTEEFDWLERTNSLTMRLKRVSVKSKQHRFSGEKKRVYVVDMAEFRDLCERYHI